MEFSATNDLSSKTSFQQRAFYKEYGLAGLSDQLNLSDFWYKNPFYGKLDKQGRVVIPDGSFLTPLYDNDAVYALDFVAGAYKAFKRSFLTSLVDRYGAKNFNSRLINIVSSKGWASADNLFFTHQQELYAGLYNLMSENLSWRKKTCNYKKFLDMYWWFTEEALKASLPITQAGFIKSKFCPPHISGLVIEIMPDQECGNDIILSDHFLKDPMFEYYVKKASEFGFSVDRNAPWRLIARVDSPKMQFFMKLHGTSWKTLFGDYYIPIGISDFDDFQKSTLNFYHAIRSAFPSTVHVKYSPGRPSGLSVHEKKLAEADEFSLYNLSELEWLEKYYIYRSKEAGMSLSRHDLKRKMKIITSAYQQSGIEEAIEALNFKCGLAKVNFSAFKQHRKKLFNNGYLNPQTLIYEPDGSMENKQTKKTPFKLSNKSYTEKQIVKMDDPSAY